MLEIEHTEKETWREVTKGQGQEGKWVLEIDLKINSLSIQYNHTC